MAPREYINPQGEVVVTDDPVQVERLGLRPLAPEEELGRAREAELEERHGGVGGQILTGLEGLASSATFGGYDAFAEFAGLSTDERAETNPGSRTVGEVGGAVGLGLLSGGTGVAGTLARATPAGKLLSKTIPMANKGVGGLVAGSALEGAAFGAGQAVSHLALSNVPLTTEAVLSEVGTGAFFGGVTGVGAGLLAGGLGKVYDKLARRQTAKAAEEAVDSLVADEVAEAATQPNFAPINLQRVGFNARVVTNTLNKNADDLLDTAARVAQASKYTGSPQQLKQWSQERYQFLTERANQVIEAAEAANLGQKHLRELNKAYTNATKLSHTILDPGIRVDGKTFATIDSNLYRFEGALRKVAKKLDEKFGDEGVGLHDDILNKLRDMDDKWHIATNSGRRSQRHGPVPTEVKQADPEMAALVKEVQKARQEFRDAWGLSNKDVLNETVFKRFEKFDPDQAQRAVASLRKYQDQLDGLATKLPHTEFPDLLKQSRAELDKIVKEAVPPPDPTSGGSGLMETLAIFGATEPLVPEFEGPTDDLLRLYLANRFVKKGARSVGVTREAARRSERRLSRGGPQDRLVNAAAGYTGYRLGDQAATAVGAQGFSGFVLRSEGASLVRDLANTAMVGGEAMAKATGKAMARVSAATMAILKGAPKVTRASGPAAAWVLNKARFGDSEDTDNSKDLYAAFRARSSELAAFMADPMKSQLAVHENLAGIRITHPMVADEMEIRIMETGKFLYEKMPKDPGTINSWGRSRWRPDEGELLRWANYVRAVEDPISVLEDAAKGNVNPQGAEVLRVLYPSLFAEAQRVLATHADQLQKNTTYDQRVRLSVLFAVPVDSSVDPNFTKWSQQFWAERMTNEEPMNGGQLKPDEPSEGQRLLGK